MELPNVGKQCSELHCKQLDFLPLKCQCGHSFCVEHFNNHVAACEFFHKNNVTNTDCKPANYLCSYTGCDNRSYVPLLCDNCNLHFCITHRHFGDNCKVKEFDVGAEISKFEVPVKQFEAAKAVINKQLDCNLNLAKKKTRTENLAKQVQLMRLKNKACGLKTISVSDRCYFNIKIPSATADKEFPIFVSRQWSLGRVIDAIASECKIVNKNNVAAARKLRLFRDLSQEMLFSDMSITLEQLLLNQKVCNGESLILDYVDNDLVYL